MNRGSHAFVAVCALTALLALAGCGKSKHGTGASTEPTDLGPVPTGVSGPTSGPDIKYKAQAGKFTGTSKDVATALDTMSKAINQDDAKLFCTVGFTKADLAVLDKKGKCTEAFKRIFGIYGGYNMDIKTITVTSPTTAKVVAVVSANYGGKLAKATNGFKLTKESGRWRLNLGLSQAGSSGAVSQPAQ